MPMQMPATSVPTTAPRPIPFQWKRPMTWPMTMARNSDSSGSLCSSAAACSITRLFLARLPRLHVLLRRLAHVVADLRVVLVVQVGERDAHRPGRAAEAAAVHQHHARLLGEAEQEVHRLVVLHHV